MGPLGPFSAAAIGAHLLGGSSLLLAHRDRIRSQPGVGASTAVKTALTLAALGTTAYSGLLGARLAKTDVKTEGGTIPAGDTPDDVARTQQRLRILQWITPALTGTLVVLGAQQGEQQRPSQQSTSQQIRNQRKSAG